MKVYDPSKEEFTKQFHAKFGDSADKDLLEYLWECQIIVSGQLLIPYTSVLTDSVRDRLVCEFNRYRSSYNAKKILEDWFSPEFEQEGE